MFTKIIEQSKVDKVSKLINKAEKIIVVSHVSPDGDAIGSSLAMAKFLELQEKQVQVIVPNALPDNLKWLKGAKDIITYNAHKSYADELLTNADLLCIVDLNELSRTSDMAESISESKAKRILIDHHLHPADFCDVIISHPDRCSTAELVFRLICRMGYFEEMTPEIAECIYTGMMTDTGAFTFNSNDPEIFYIISQLLTKGIDKDAIYRNVYHTYRESRLRLQGYVLNDKMITFPTFNASLIWLTRDELKRYSYVKGETDGLVNMPLSIKGMRLSAFIHEDTEKPQVRISLRSVGNVPCNLMASEYFNGGGHKNASGGEYKGSIEEAIELFKQMLVKYEDYLK